MKIMESIVCAAVTALVAGCDGGTLRFEDDAAADGAFDSTVDGTGDIPADTHGDGPTDPLADPTTDPHDMRDTDGDTIRDADEGDGAVDTDADGIWDSEDTDSDGDGFTDAEEAEDDDLSTPPGDCDLDGIPSFRDLDSDSDGLSDPAERDHMTDPCDPDSDDDGTSDLGEVAYGSDPLDPSDNPTSLGDFVFMMPHGESPSPVADTLVFSTNLKVADVYLLMDQTCSLMDEISALLASMTGTIIPGIKDEIADAWFGVGAFEDCSGGTWGCPNELARLSPMTPDVSAVTTALGSVAAECCGGSEPYYQALYTVATGDLAPFATWVVHPTSWTCTPPGSIGWPCFRSQAVPIIVMLGDEDLDDAGATCSPFYATADAVAALSSIDARFIGLNAGESHDDMVRIATGTGSVDMLGNPLVFDVSGGSGIGTQVVDAVSQIATAVPIRVDALAHDDTTDFIDAVTAFVQAVHTNTSGDPIWDPILLEMRECTSGIPVGTPGTPPTSDFFEIVQPGQSVCFDIVPKTNTTISPTTVPLVFRATIEVLGDLHTPLDTREVVFVVPPSIPGG